jgi:hypothetical protein
LDWVGVLFTAGVLLGMVSTFRINIRVFQLMYAWGYGSKWDPFKDLIVAIKLRNTLFLEIAGLLVSIIMCWTAIGLFQKAGL